MSNFSWVVCLVVMMCGFFGKTGSSSHRLQWAPVTLKTPYITFLNSFYYASWKTRNSITKEDESLRYLQLPRGVPFSVACGACFHPSTALTNLTISVTNHNYFSIPKTHGNKFRQFNEGYLSCLMTYVLTAPIHNSGQITCTLQRGQQVKSEVISFGVVDVSVDEVPEELENQNEAEGIHLHCPTPDESPSRANPLVHVWHQDPPATDIADLKLSLIPQLAPSISLRRPSQTRQVVCSVYNIRTPTKVYRTRYRILGSHMNRHQYQLSNDLLEYQEDMPTQKMASEKGLLSNTLVGIIIAAVVISALIIIMGLYQLIVTTRKK